MFPYACWCIWIHVVDHRHTPTEECVQFVINTIILLLDIHAYMIIHGTYVTKQHLPLSSVTHSFTPGGRNEHVHIFPIVLDKERDRHRLCLRQSTCCVWNDRWLLKACSLLMVDSLIACTIVSLDWRFPHVHRINHKMFWHVACFGLFIHRVFLVLDCRLRAVQWMPVRLLMRA